MSPVDRWLAIPQPVTNARLNLLTLPYAGSGATIFYKWAKPLAVHGIQLAPIMLPGRESRLGEPLYRDVKRLANDLAEALAPVASKPWALYGHSMGAVIAYEFLCALRDQGLPGPQHLFVSGRNAPNFPWKLGDMDALSDAEFIEKINHMFGAIPDSVKNSPELLEIFVPILKADFALLEKYDFEASTALECPISVLDGIDDDWTQSEKIHAWKNFTTQSFDYQVFEGDHFFIQSMTDEVIQHMVARLSASTLSP